jgi:aldehyde dehydrogenase (NAD+)
MTADFELNWTDCWQYTPAPESTGFVRVANRYGHFINGEFVDGVDYYSVQNPANLTTLSEVPTANTDCVDRAVQAAQAAAPAWQALSGVRRGQYLYRIGRLLQEHARELAILETMNNGKPIKESRDVDIPLAAAHFLYYAGWADKLAYVLAGGVGRPLGVVAQIIPWNFPLLMAAWKIAPALAAGNTVVLKPAETTPLTALKLAALCQAAELPPGVVNIITGAGQTGADLVRHPGVQKIAFTGSTEVGKQIQKALAGSAKTLTLELGGKGANIIFEDAALDQAVEGIVQGIFFNQGQVCCAGSRLLVQESVAAVVLAKLKQRLKTLRVGDPLDKNTDVGAIHSAAQLQKIEHYIALGQAEGAVLYQPGATLPNTGYFCQPTLFTEVTQAHRIAQDEIFGPVLSVLTFRTPSEALAKANNSPYGLAAGVWTNKGSKLNKIAGSIQAGVIWGNTYNRFDPASPFGGYRESGFGREGGAQGLLPYLDWQPFAQVGQQA